MKISVVMPVLNEAKNLQHTLTSLKLTEQEELIVVDGNSSDDTVSLARRFTKNVFIAEKGRARQMNFGAEKAEGDILLFLHADCELPEHGFTLIRNILKNTGVAAGAFDLSIDHPAWRFRVIAFGANLRSRITGIPYGDQGIFMAKEVFMEVGGFAEIPLMEDVEISGRLKRIGKIIFVKPPIKTSPRRWLTEGAFSTTLRDWSNVLLYRFLKVDPERLARYYRDIR
ncbi:MAG: TIGR04283 family arsenosugar biosynthesis glycosyltransferase [Nitrospiraceae bacterium]|nr:MAG: TIGR04283 family arsenosugar biosynthesis glycosyltransferase [Nitrospiraceae bacterium]